MDKKQLRPNAEEYYLPCSPYANSPIYNPFERSHDPKTRPSIVPVEQKYASSKVLFETEDYLDTEEAIQSGYLEDDAPSQQEIMERLRSFTTLFGERSQRNLNKKAEDNKQNSSSNQTSSKDVYEPFAFGRRMRVKYPQTPNFKKLVKNSFVDFNKQFANKQEALDKMKDPSPIIPKVSPETAPMDFMKRPYKFFMGLGEHFKKLQKIQQSLIFYRIAIYLQPKDTVVWETIAKLCIDSGNQQVGLTLLVVGILMTQSEVLLEKYLKALDKTGIICQEFPRVGLMILEACGGKVERFAKYFVELSKHYDKSIGPQHAFTLLLYMYTKYQFCGNCLIDIVKLLEIQKQHTMILSILKHYIENNYVRYPILYQTYIKFLMQCQDQQKKANGLRSVEQRVSVACVKDSKSRVLCDLAEAYHQIGLDQRCEECLKKAFELAKEPFRSKVYLAICSHKKIKIPYLRNTHMILQINKQIFVEGCKQQPIIWNFSEWKYYLQYSLFHVLSEHEGSYRILENYAKVKGNSGRIHAELIWIERVKQNNQAALRKWEECVMEMPKSGEIWCEGGRIMMNKGDINKARRYFEMAVQLTPQYGDPFVELLFIYLAQGKYQSIKKLKKKLLFYEPNYGSLWCYLKQNYRSSVIDVWRRGKTLLKAQLYKWNRRLDSKIRCGKHLTALEEFNELFFRQRSLITRAEREKLYSLYDQLQ